MNAVLASHDLVWLVLDSLRYDVARDALAAGDTPNLAALFPAWEERHAPGSFTWASLHAFLSGFLPTPARSPRAPRLFAARFATSETVTPGTFVFDEAYLPEALSARGWRTIAIGGVGFFNPHTGLGRVLHALFDECHWSPELGPESPDSGERQFALAAQRLAAVPAAQPAFLFVNVSAIHAPNRIYRGTPGPDDPASHRAALRHVDSHLPRLRRAIAARNRPALVIACSDHGTAYGEDGYLGHRLAHPTVWTVPYADCVLPVRTE